MIQAASNQNCRFRIDTNIIPITTAGYEFPARLNILFKSPISAKHKKLHLLFRKKIPETKILLVLQNKKQMLYATASRNSYCKLFSGIKTHVLNIFELNNKESKRLMHLR